MSKGVGVIHPGVSLAFINDTVGFGLVAAQPLPAGTIVWCQDPLDIRLTHAQLKALGPLFDAHIDRYAWTDASGDRVLCWDIGRFMNHGCRPNSMSPGLPMEIALRDIAVGEEVVCDYGILNLDAGFDCACGMAECRGRIEPRDFDVLADAWDARLQAVFPQVARVPQALAGLRASWASPSTLRPCRASAACAATRLSRPHSWRRRGPRPPS